jgi:glycosyltransferase involved in cell wall biosynthesis
MSSEALASTRLEVRHAGSQLGRLGVVAATGDSIPNPDPDLEVRLEVPLPAGMPASSETAFFIYGSCFHRRLRIRAIEVLTGSEATPATYGMPRADLHAAVHQSDAARPGPGREILDDPGHHAYRSGFWAIAPLRMPPSGAVEVALAIEISDGSSQQVTLGAVPVVSPAKPDDEAVELAQARGARVGLAMATYEPEIELFRTQIESIRSQTVEDWICVISDDCSSPSRFGRMQEVVSRDERFVLRRAPRRRGFYRNFERALELMPREVPYLALADQDDRWYPDKLETLLGAIGDAQLVYSDQRVLDEEGRELSPSYWTGRRNNYDNLPSLLLANTITGAASLFRRELLDRALPFPETPGTQYHDHWLALVALACGRIAYVDRPLYDYVQHGSAALGRAAASVSAAPGAREIVRRLRHRRGLAQIVASRTGYFFDLTRLQLLARVLLMRCGSSMRWRDRRALRRLLRVERSPLSLAWLALRPVRNVGRQSVTLGAERLMLQAVAWRYAVLALSVGQSRPHAWSNYDASLPPPSPPRSTVAAVDQPFVRHLASKVEPLQLSITDRAPKRVNLLIPTIDLTHLFGGYIAKFNLARRLAERGHRTRLVTVDPAPQLPRDWRERVESFAGLDGLFDTVEIALGRDRDAPLELNPEDSLIATTWWTADIAGHMLRSLTGRRFLYLIQEYEPYTFPMGSLAALAKATYELPHVALFSTELLRDFFAARRYGVFAAGEKEGRRDSVSFENAITRVSPPSAGEMGARERRRLLFYARPEAHAARNMFELGALALTQAILNDVFGSRWSFHGIGAVDEPEDVRLASANLQMVTRRGQSDYAEFLTGFDVGLALMFTPHPSLVPLEMASAGLVTVTNTFETKTRGAMEAISGNLLAAEPSLDGIVAGLQQAVERADDSEARVANSAVDWSRDWDQSLDDRLMESVERLLAAC